MGTDLCKRQELLTFLYKELDMSYERVKEVGGYQKGVITWMLTFYGFFLGALIFADNETLSCLRQNLEIIAWLIPVLVLIIGLAFFGQYVSYESYICGYKSHTLNMEDALINVLQNKETDGIRDMNLKLTYYAEPIFLPKKFPNKMKADPSFKTLSGLMGMLTLGLIILSLQELDLMHNYWLLIPVVLVVAFHFILFFCLFKNPHLSTAEDPSTIYPCK